MYKVVEFITSVGSAVHSDSVVLHQPPKKEYVNYKTLQQQIKEKKQKAREETQPVRPESSTTRVLSKWQQKPVWICLIHSV